MGDFNLHHPAWGGERSERDPSSDQLLELTDTRCLDLWLEPGTTTWERNGSKTTIDLVLGSQDLTPRLVSCEVNERVHADSDYYPIRTLLDISTKTPEAQLRRNWKACSVKDLQSFVDLNLQTKAFPLQTKKHIELAMEYLIETVNQGIAASTPWAKPSKWANPSFNAECREMVKITRKFRREYTESVIANGSVDPTTGLRWEHYTKVRNRKGKVLAKALRQGHRSWVRKATESGPRGMWRAAKWARSKEARGGLIPTLITDGGLAETAEQKVEVFRKAFFPEPPPADLSDILTARIPPQIDFPDLTEHEVLYCTRRAPPDKAPGPDGIPNKVWHWLGEVSYFLAVLTQIFNACLRLGHNPEYFQQSTTVVLHKVTSRDYRLAKSYRPIAFLNTIGKILEAVATREAIPHDQLHIKDHATGFIIKPVEHAKSLGIWLDRTLSFDTHRVKALAKANGTLEALRSISGSTLGTSLLSMRRIYLAVETAIRIQTGPDMACPRGLRWERLKEAFKGSGYSLIEALKWKKTGPLYAYGDRQEEWETRRAHVLAPWELPLRCIIEGAEAVQTHDRVCRENRQIWYTDRSGYQGMIGTAALSIRAEKTARKHLGTELNSTVYVGESEGARMALDRAKLTPITVFSDSQAAIQAVRNPGRPSGQYALRAIYGRIRALRNESLKDAELR
ncbi:uncharacterized protein KD926_004996 [Aspergillus affinis]|uniref:uncharacterized protein n=1 Tax=Aspergillus affinis TaxID=1070780 RepID=UPI0022FDF204|nr:uncharacterized protein KD926_004996 [Aspergillus affinis]KAI9034948.1 hypothetical protein KD926_004996 [Aspergillus affinis]